MTLTDQQRQIIEYDENAVVIAMPGSGKTMVLSEKVRRYISLLKNYQGIIAISYTNKASFELRDRSLKNGLDPKNSFFGTIDRFAISEIVVPFGKHLFGLPENDIRVQRINSLDVEEQTMFEWFDRSMGSAEFTNDQLKQLADCFHRGVVLLDTVGVLSNYIFANSAACRRYISARYRFIFIDEYQDAGPNQHQMFVDITRLGVVGIAVGDVNQSIYAFSGKSSKYLVELLDSGTFKGFPLTLNHRCHQSIINYSNYLLDPNADLEEVDANNVYFQRIEGKEEAVANWIDRAVRRMPEKFHFESLSQIAVLTRGNRTAEILHQSLQTPNKLSVSTELDESYLVWSQVFMQLLRYAFDLEHHFVEVISEFTTLDRLKKRHLQILVNLRRSIRPLFNAPDLSVDDAVSTFVKVAKILAPNSDSPEAIRLLRIILEDRNQVNSYRPPADNEISVMTLHKSKGLEFDAVIHVDLHEWVLPSKAPGPGNDWDNPVHNDWYQDLNLHYVGITRAKTLCVLLSSTERTNNKNQTKSANDSEFLSLNRIQTLRNGGR